MQGKVRRDSAEKSISSPVFTGKNNSVAYINKWSQCQRRRMITVENPGRMHTVFYRGTLAYEVVINGGYLAMEQ
jgi:hypothetical protein